ncbi:Uncharacterised protein [Mycobacterium tuberculosis]|uniref:Uncharacterized protein n=1 Tax=Mycobacterium tuberculosis TaxID=1773 RepID=A0A655FEU3_MYCTX|nr:Uncharacterised protein [Mycobacterium tuberculosis]CFR77878.1 Uncharacterised protein [Mycobacterium tuberculosis]CKQ05107.1 Uncharacterised protein [Mycobacterium tuberculosis]CKR32632.1 Uncharacterised protein [Mycobacterium tuberculosis]CKR70211.1 Uncharacterised protein [Mycobacterium tuberculosis]
MVTSPERGCVPRYSGSSAFKLNESVPTRMLLRTNGYKSTRTPLRSKSSTSSSPMP